MSFSADIHNIFVLTLALFTLGAMMLATYTVANAVRLRNIRISWKSGKLGGYPLFSTLFLIFSAGMATLMYTHQISPFFPIRSEEHTSELQSRGHIVCRLLLEIK